MSRDDARKRVFNQIPRFLEANVYESNKKIKRLAKDILAFVAGNEKDYRRKQLLFADGDRLIGGIC